MNKNSNQSKDFPEFSMHSSVDSIRESVDPTTELPDRYAFYRLLYAPLEQTNPTNFPSAVILIHFDNFQKILSSRGHAFAEQVMKLITEMLQVRCDGAKSLFRLDSNRLGWILNSDDRSFSALEFAQDQLKNGCLSIELDSERIRMVASMGVVEIREAYSSPDEILVKAESALEKIMGEAGRGVELYREGIEEGFRNDDNLTNDLHTALEEDQFHLFYQPLISFENGELAGLEALIRWKHPEKGWISPGQFLPQAEQTGLILFIGQWVLEEGIRRCGEFRERWERDFYMSINISPRQFQDPEFVKKVERHLSRYNVPASKIELELTEHTVAEDGQRAQEHLQDLQNMGVQMALDDFGTGYSSFNHLANLPINTIKLDRSFAASQPGDGRQKSLIDLMIAAARSLGLRVVAEGIETSEQWDVLGTAGCDLAQGFYLSRPKAADDVEQWLKNYGIRDSISSPPSSSDLIIP